MFSFFKKKPKVPEAVPVAGASEASASGAEALPVVAV
ncbi:MAG: hypothetical protein RLZZ182_25, partial [Pseudomonadota bacterium]